MADFDRDGLRNLAEFRLGGEPRDEDTDNDGHDDDEVKDGFRATALDDPDTDDDSVEDGDEDTDRDGIDNEDADDAKEPCRRDDDDRDDDQDVCDGERDDDGEADEDADDLLGTIVSFDAGSGLLTIDLAVGGQVAATVTEETEIELEEREGSTADLVPGATVAEIDIDDDGTLEEIELSRS